MNSERPVISRRTIGIGASWSVVGLGSQQLLSLIIFLVTARFVSKESFGIMASSLAIVEFLKRVVVEPFGVAVNAKPDASDEDFNASFLISAALSILISVILFAAAPLVAYVMGNDAIAQGLRLVSVMLVSVGLSRTHEAWMVRHLRFKQLSIRSVVGVTAGGVVGVSMAVHGFQLWSLAGQQLVTSFVSLTLLWISCAWRPRLTTTRASVRAVASEARHISTSAIGGFFTTELDIFIAASFLGVRAAGIYNAAKRIMLAINMMLSSSIQNVTLSVFVNLTVAERRANAFVRAIGTISAITVPASFGIASLSHDAIVVLLGPTWVASAPVLRALAIGAFLASTSQLNSAVFMTSRQARLSARLGWGSAILNALTMPLFVSRGAVALAATASVVQALLFFISAIAASRSVGISLATYLRVLVGPFLAASAMAAGLSIARPLLDLHGILALLVLVPLGCALYFAILLVVDRPAVINIMEIGRAVLARRDSASDDRGNITV